MTSLENYRNSDFFITLSRTNTKLRDEYSSLEELFLTEGLDETDFVEYFHEHGYRYNPDVNSFQRED